MMVPELIERGVHTSGLSHSFHLLSLSHDTSTITFHTSTITIPHQLSESCHGVSKFGNTTPLAPYTFHLYLNVEMTLTADLQ